MEALLVVSGMFLAHQYSSMVKQRDKLGASPNMDWHRFDTDRDVQYRDLHPQHGPGPVVGPQRPDYGNENFIVEMNKEEFAKEPVQATSQRRPGWVRASEAQGLGRPRQEVEVDIMKESGAPNLPYMANYNDAYRQQGQAALNPRTSQQGNLPFEPIRERPTQKGGFDGYDSLRGRLPLPRYNRYDLGEEKTASLGDDGRVRGFAFGEAGRSEKTREGWDTMQNRVVQADNPPQSIRSASLRGGVGGAPLAWLGGRSDNDHDTLTVEDPSSGRVANIRQGTGHFVDHRGAFQGEDVATDRQLPGLASGAHIQQSASRQAVFHPPGMANVPAYSSRTGASAHTPIPRGLLGMTADNAVPPPLRASVDILNKGMPQTRVGIEKGWEYSFDVAELANQIQRIRMPEQDTAAGRATQQPVTQADRLQAGEQEAVSSDKQVWRRLETDMDKIVPLQTRANREDADALPRDYRVVNEVISASKQLQRKAVANSAAPKPLVQPDKRVLFSDAERNDYKLDTKTLDMHRPDIAPATSRALQGINKSAITVAQPRQEQTSVIRTFETGGLVNSRLRAQTAGAPRNIQVGSAAKEHRFDTDSGFVQAQKQGSGPLTRPVDSLRASQAVSKKQTWVFPDTQQTKESTTQINTQKKEQTQHGSRHSRNAARTKVSSQPQNSASLDPHRRFGDFSTDQIDYKNDDIAVAGGNLRQPLLAPKSKVPDYAAAQAGSVGTMRGPGEFRRR
jgi:hypothetical protein